MEQKTTIHLNKPSTETGPPRHEHKKGVVTTEEEYDQFFREYDAQLNRLVKNLHEDVSAFGSDTPSTEMDVFATQKSKDFSSFLERIGTIGRETEQRFLDSKRGVTPYDQEKIEQFINPLALVASAGTAYHQALYRFFRHDTLTQAQEEACQLANKGMREPLFKYSLQTLTTYLENDQKQTAEKKEEDDPRFQKEHACTIIKMLSKLAVQTRPIDLNQCHDLLAFVANNHTILRELVPDWHQKTLYPLAERIIQAGHVAATSKQNSSPETMAASTVDLEQVAQCATIFVPLLKQEIEAATTLSALSSWYKLDLTQRHGHSEEIPPPRYLIDLESTAKERTNHLLQEKGLSGEIMKAWQISQKPEDMGQYVVDNLRLIEKLEEAAPGAAKALHTEFGIQNFARQSLSFWLKQYQERENLTTPYGALLSPADDWNGAFSNGHLANLVDQAVGQMKGEVFIRIIECKNKVDAVRRLLHMKQRYQAPQGGNAMSFAIIAGHGSKNSIRIGQPEATPKVDSDEPPPLANSDEPPPLDEAMPPNIDLITPSDIVGPGMRRLKTLFRPDAPIVLISCSTGQEGGIGETMSEAYLADLAAPTVPTHVESWNFTATPEGKVTINTVYIREEGKPGISTTAFYPGNRPSEPPPL